MRETAVQAEKSGLLQWFRSSSRALRVSTSPWSRYSSSVSRRGGLGPSLALCILLPVEQHQLLPAQPVQDPQLGQSWRWEEKSISLQPLLLAPEGGSQPQRGADHCPAQTPGKKGYNAPRIPTPAPNPSEKALVLQHRLHPAAHPGPTTAGNQEEAGVLEVLTCRQQRPTVRGSPGSWCRQQ